MTDETEEPKRCPNCNANLGIIYRRPPLGWFTYAMVGGGGLLMGSIVIPLRYFAMETLFYEVITFFGMMCLGMALIVISDISQVVAWLADDYNRCYRCQHPLTPSQAPERLQARAGQNACPHCGARRNQLFATRREQVGCLSLIFFFPIIFLPILVIVPVELASPLTYHRYYRHYPPDTMEWVYFMAALIALSVIIGLIIPWLVAWLSDDGYTCYYCQRPFHLKPPAEPRTARRPLYQRSSGLRWLNYCPNCGSRQWFAAFRRTKQDEFWARLERIKYLTVAFVVGPWCYWLYDGQKIAFLLRGFFAIVGFIGLSVFLVMALHPRPNTCPCCWHEYDDLVPYEQNKRISLKKKKKR